MANAKIIAQKEELVNKLAEELKGAKGIVFADYRGITVAQDTALRRKARTAGVEYRVVKNTMVRLAAQKAGIEGLDTYLEGLTVMALSTEDVVAPAKLVSDFIKESKIKTYKIKAGIIDSTVIDDKGVEQLANLPSREVLLAKMLGSMQSPIAGFVNVLAGSMRNLVYALDAVRKQKESA